VTESLDVGTEVRTRVQSLFDRQGLMGHLGARLGHVAPGCAHIMLPHRAEVTQQHGYFHAGVVGAIADGAGACAAMTLFPEDASLLGVEYKLNFLAVAAGEHVEAVGTVLKAGRTLTVCRLEVFAGQDGRRTLVAAGQQTLIRVDARPEN
jgi:uncharacterized protein (TIGR00369 family)